VLVFFFILFFFEVDDVPHASACPQDFSPWGFPFTDHSRTDFPGAYSRSSLRPVLAGSRPPRLLARG